MIDREQQLKRELDQLKQACVIIRRRAARAFDRSKCHDAEEAMFWRAVMDDAEVQQLTERQDRWMQKMDGRPEAFLELLEQRAKELAPDYPYTKHDAFEWLWAITSTCEGTEMARQDWEDEARRRGWKPQEVDWSRRGMNWRRCTGRSCRAGRRHGASRG